MTISPLIFDEKGCLKPYGIIKTDLETLKETFVFNEHRQSLFSIYQDFNAEFQAITECPLIQWMGGSFVTLKEFPKDIDTVTFIPFEIFNKKENELEKFRMRYRSNRIDCFFEYIYPNSHKSYQNYISNHIYWNRLYSKYPVQRQAVRWLPKGFIEINL
jgi:hypothetical protein